MREIDGSAPLCLLVDSVNSVLVKRIAVYIAQQMVQTGKDRQSARAVLLRIGCGRGYPCLERATRHTAP